MAALGKRNLLPIVRASAPGLYLDGGELGEILLPGRYIPRDLKPGDKLDVFLYLDSEERLVATTENSLASVGDFACLEVDTVHPRMGAFLHWGLEKDLLLPYREQEKHVRVGQKVVVFVYVDPVTNRIVATTRLSRHLSQEPPTYSDGQAVNIIISGPTPMGYNAIVENAHRGLLYKDNLAAPLEVGQRLKAYVRAIHPNGKIDLRLDQSGYKRVQPLKIQIVDALKKNGGRLGFDDSSSPEDIRNAFGCSKGAFKQTLGALYKSRRIRFTKPGIELVDNSEWAPGKEPLRPKSFPPR